MGQRWSLVLDGNECCCLQTFVARERYVVRDKLINHLCMCITCA